MQSIHIRVPDETHEALRSEAFTSRRSMNQVINDSIEMWFVAVRGEEHDPYAWKGGDQ